MAKDTFYFSHDYNSRNDSKIKKLISKYGILGYGLFWAIIEDLYNNTNVLPADYECIAFDMRVEESLVKSIINDFDLFVVSDGFFGSQSVERRLNERNDKSKKARESVLKRWEKCEIHTNVLRSKCECNTIKESKVNEIKGEESKIEEIEDAALVPIVKNTNFVKFEVWILENCPQVAKMKEPFTEAQFLKISKDFSRELIKETIEAMHNKKDLLKKYNSANLTLRSWINLKNQKNGQSTKSEPTDAYDKLSETIRNFGNVD